MPFISDQQKREIYQTSPEYIDRPDADFSEVFAASVGVVIDEELSVSRMLNREGFDDRKLTVKQLIDSGKIDPEPFTSPRGVFDYEKAATTLNLPEVKTNLQLNEERNSLLAQRRAYAEDVISRGSGTAQFLGGATGYMLDPINIATMGISTAATGVKALSTIGNALITAKNTALLTAATELAIQPLVYQHKASIDSPYSEVDAISAIAMAAAGGAVIGGVVGSISGYLAKVNAAAAKLPQTEDIMAAVQANNSIAQSLKNAPTKTIEGEAEYLRELQRKKDANSGPSVKKEDYDEPQLKVVETDGRVQAGEQGRQAAKTPEEAAQVEAKGASEAVAELPPPKRKEVISKDGDEFDFKGQSKAYTREVFGREVLQPKSEARSSIDALIDADKVSLIPKKEIKISDLFPTQRFIHKENLNRVTGSTSDIGAIILKSEGRLYIIDGHHRIAANLVNGNNKVSAHVLDLDKTGTKADENLTGLIGKEENAGEITPLKAKAKPEQYHPAITGMARELTIGGDIALVSDEFGAVIGRTGRTASTNPEWFQNLAVEKVDGQGVRSKKVSVKEVKRAVEAFEAGNPTKSQAKILEAMSDVVTEEEKLANAQFAKQQEGEAVERGETFSSGRQDELLIEQGLLDEYEKAMLDYSRLENPIIPDGDELIDADIVMKQLDEELDGLNSIVVCASE